MAIKLFPNAKTYTLNEDDKANPHKSAYENYTGVVFDTVKNEFKIVTGKFRDKKDMYNKMTKQDKYLRRAYESKIWDWIQDNAETPIDGYLMLSTAVSKWVNNNVLSKYYVKLLHDLPYINREGRKGDPQTMGTEASFESVEETKEDKMLNEAIMNEAWSEEDAKKQLAQDIEDGLASKHDVTIYPVINGKIGNKPLIHYPNEYLYDKLLDMSYANRYKIDKRKAEQNRVFGPELYRKIYLNTKTRAQSNNGIAGELSRDKYKGDQLAFVIDDKFSDPIIVDKTSINSILTNYITNGANWLPLNMRNTKQNKNNDKAETNIITGVTNKEFDPSVHARYKSELGKAKMSDIYKLKLKELKNEQRKILDAYNLSDKEKAEQYNDSQKEIETFEKKYNRDVEKIKELKADKDRITKTAGIPAYEKADIFKQIDKEIQDIKSRYTLDILKNRPDRDFIRKEKAAEYAYQYNRPISYSNPLHNSNANTEFLSRIGSKINLRDILTKQAKLAAQNGDIELADKYRHMYEKDPVEYTDEEVKAAEQVIKKWNKEKDIKPEIKTRRIDDMLQVIFSKNPKADEALLQKAAYNVTNRKATELLNNDSNLSDKYANIINAGYDYFNNPENDKEFFTDLNKEYFKLQKESNIQEESAVNDGANALMQQTDSAAKAEQKYCLSNINEEKTKSKLNQELFDGEELKEDIRQALIKIADEFKEKLKLPFEPVDVYFTGSEANYNYNEHSDIDLHLVYDFEQAGVSAEILSKYLQSAKRVFNDEHDITVKSIPVEVGAENIAEPLTTSGVYSLISNTWVIKPEYSNVEIEEPEQATLDEVRNQIEDAISDGNQLKIEGMIKTVWDMRKEGLKKEGEFGPSNTLFKTLRNEGVLARLKDAYYAAESRDLSLESIIKEDFFKGHDEIFTIEDDLINKSEQEIYDGLMDHYKGNTDEALAKLEDVIQTCDDGYKDKLEDVVKKIHESNNFENKCNKIIEETLSNLTEAPLYIEKDSYIDHINDEADAKDILKLCYAGIHPNFKYKRVPLRYDDNEDNGIEKAIILKGIERGKNPTNVIVQVIGIGKDSKGFNKILYNKDSIPMPIQKFLEILNDPKNIDWNSEITSNEPELEDIIDIVHHKLDDIANSYNNWYEQYKDEYELDRYSEKARKEIYKHIVKDKWRPSYVFNLYRKIDDWRNDIQEESTLDEAKEYMDAFEYGKYVQDILEKNGISKTFIQTPFAVEPDKVTIKNPLMQQLVPQKKYYIIKGIDWGSNPENVWIQEVTKDARNIEKRAHPISFNWIKEQMAVSAKGDQDNSDEAISGRAYGQIFNKEGKTRLGRTGREGHWFKLMPEEIRQVLAIVEEEQATEIAKRKQKYPNVRFDTRFKNLKNIYDNNPDDPVVSEALRIFDPENESCIKHMKNNYYIWVPTPDGMNYPPKHGRNVYDQFMKM